jgi:hypothetical protein
MAAKERAITAPVPQGPVTAPPSPEAPARPAGARRRERKPQAQVQVPVQVQVQAPADDLRLVDPFAPKAKLGATHGRKGK